MNRRRALFGMGTCLMLGAFGGAACGYAAGRPAAGRPAAGSHAAGSHAARNPNPAAVELAPSGDARLDELRRLAVVAPIEELMGKMTMFLQAKLTSYPDDRTLWQGVQRMADRVIEDSQTDNRRIKARFLLQAIESNALPDGLDLSQQVAGLRSIR